MSRFSVSEVLRRFIPSFLNANPALSLDQRRAIWAITFCRTAAMGGERYVCDECGCEHFAYHSCNHRSCPQCGRAATKEWIEKQLSNQVNAPYFLVTFTVPEELRECFFGESAKDAYDILFASASGALKEKLASAKGFKAVVGGFTAILHTWNQRLEFHPHLHVLVPGAGIDVNGKVVQVKKADFLLHLPLLQAAFRQHFRDNLAKAEWAVNPVVWRKNWGVHIQPCGSGVSAVKYLGAYVSRTAIGDGRIVAMDEKSVTFQWKDRSDGGKVKTLTLSGDEFVRRYLRHVLPRGLRAIRYYGFCHPAAKRKREKVRMHTGTVIQLGSDVVVKPEPQGYLCPSCAIPMRFVEELKRQFVIPPWVTTRGPPPRKLIIVRGGVANHG